MRPVVLLTAVAVAASVAGCGAASTPLPGSEAAELHGGVLRPPNREPALTLTDTSGRPYDVVGRNRGKVTLVYFGYTHCPDVCPTTMADIAQALRNVPATVASQVTVVFVTVDPHRDSLRVLRRWLDRYDPAFVGLRGSLRWVVDAQRAAHLPASRVSPDGTTVEHAAQIIAYTPDREEHALYLEGPSTIGDLEHDLPILVSGKDFGA